jgi:hypothetical protein
MIINITLNFNDKNKSLKYLTYSIFSNNNWKLCETPSCIKYMSCLDFREMAWKELRTFPNASLHKNPVVYFMWLYQFLNFNTIAINQKLNDLYSPGHRPIDYLCSLSHGLYLPFPVDQK